jgi:hypothetical protein
MCIMYMMPGPSSDGEFNTMCSSSLVASGLNKQATRQRAMFLSMTLHGMRMSCCKG